MDKLTVGELTAYVAYIEHDCPSFNPIPLLPVMIAKQLLDTMRENARLCHSVSMLAYDGLSPKQRHRIASDILIPYPNRHTENGCSICGARPVKTISHDINCIHGKSSTTGTTI